MSIGSLVGQEELATNRSVFKGRAIDKEEKPNLELESCYTTCTKSVYCYRRFSYYTSCLCIVELRPFLKVEILLTLGQFWPQAS